jgi:endonuclease/exonuclease/phosphatase (EEP) superfamily protein YafD
MRLIGYLEGCLDKFLNFAGLAAVSATLWPLLRHDAWWVRIFDFPRVQIAALTGAVLAADVTLRRNSALPAHLMRTALGLSLLFQAHRIRPYTPLARRQVKKAARAKPESTVNLFLANVRMENRRSARLREIIAAADPDVALVLEADDWWHRELEPLAQDYPCIVSRPQPNFYGILLYSRLELIAPEVRFLIEDDIPSIRTRLKLRSGIEVDLYCLHPKPPVPQESPQSTERDAELLVAAKEIKGTQRPVILMGDLNDVAWSRTNNLFQKVSGLVDPRLGRGFYNSFHAEYWFLRFPVDHFFHSTHFRLIELNRLPYFGSDHFPMQIRLSYEPDAQAVQQAPEPRPTEEAEASEKIAKAAK